MNNLFFCEMFIGSVIWTRQIVSAGKHEARLSRENVNKPGEWLVWLGSGVTKSGLKKKKNEAFNIFSVSFWGRG